MHDLSSTTKLDSYPRTRLSWFPGTIYFRVEDYVVGATTQAHLRLACTATHVTVYFGGELNDGNLADPRERGEATVRTFRVLGTELVPLSQLQEEGGETAAAEEADGELFQQLVDAVPSASSLADLRALHVLLAEYPGDLDQRDDGGCTLLLRAIESSRGAVAQLHPPRVRRLPGGARRERAHASPRSRAGQRRTTSRAVLHARHKSGPHASPCPTPSRPATFR